MNINMNVNHQYRHSNSSNSETANEYSNLYPNNKYDVSFIAILTIPFVNNDTNVLAYVIEIISILNIFLYYFNLF